MVRTESLGDYVVREKKTLSPRLTELAILVVARQGTQQYLWSFHRPAAIRNGIPEGAVNAIAAGEAPSGLSDDERALYDFCRELLDDPAVTDATYTPAMAKFGAEGVIDTEGWLGYYTVLAMAMNTANTPAPKTSQPELKPLRP
jgi:4-carboxymuconolactone decarboxylase